MFLKVRKGPNGCFRKQLNRSLIGGEHVAFASLQRIIPPIMAFIGVVVACLLVISYVPPVSLTLRDWVYR